MKNAIENKIFDFVVNNTYIEEKLIIDIGSYIYKKYGYDDNNKLASKANDPKLENISWNYVMTAAIEYNDVYSIATLLFYKKYNTSIFDTKYYLNNDYILRELIEILEQFDEKDAFIYFLLGKANFTGRGAELDNEKAIKYFNKANALGIEIAKLFVCELEDDYENLFKTANILFNKDPDNHIIRFYLGYCYYYGYGTEQDYKMVYELFKFTFDINEKNPIDYYFLESRYLLGLCYFHGYVVPKDLNIALNLFKYSALEYMPKSKYALAITTLLLNLESNPKEIFELLEKSALKGYLPAVRKVMLCLRVGYGTDINNDLYNQYKEYFDYYKENVNIFSDLGKEADNISLFPIDDSIINDEEC